MTTEEAIDKAARAIEKSYGRKEDNWKTQGKTGEAAKHIVAALEGLLKLSQ